MFCNGSRCCAPRCACRASQDADRFSASKLSRLCAVPRPCEPQVAHSPGGYILLLCLPRWHDHIRARHKGRTQGISCSRPSPSAELICWTFADTPCACFAKPVRAALEPADVQLMSANFKPVHRLNNRGHVAMVSFTPPWSSDPALEPGRSARNYNSMLD